MAGGVARVWAPVDDMAPAGAFHRDTLGLQERTPATTRRPDDRAERPRGH